MTIGLENLFQDLENNVYTDCTFVFPKNDCKTITAHKMYLALVSPVFRAALFGNLQETGPITITDIPFEAFEKMIWIIYGETVMPSSTEEACQLYNAAQKYDLPEPLTVARNYMIENMSESTVNAFYNATILHDDDEVIESCFATGFQKIFDTTKIEGFFDTTEPVEEENTFEIEESDEGNVLKATIEAYMAKMKEEHKYVMDEFTVKTLELVRILTSATKNAFKLIISESMATFTCSLTWIPPKGTVASFNASCLPQLNPVQHKCRIGHLTTLTCNSYRCGASVSCPPEVKELITKYRHKDLSACTLDDLKIMYETYGIYNV